MDKLSDFRYTMTSCNSCGQCRFILGPRMKGWEYAEICPIHLRYRWDAYSGQGLINIAQELLEGELDYGDGLIEHIYTCTTCGACDINCKSVRDMEVLDTILALRARCVEDGRGPLPPHLEQARYIEAHHNIFGEPHEERSDWLPEGIKLSEKADVAYFAGCSAAYKHPGIARNTARILNAGGLDFKVLPDEYCCGAPLWRTGQTEAARKLAEHNMEAFRENGIRTVVTACAECYGTFRGFYPRIAPPDFEVVHISEVVHRMLRKGKLEMKGKLDIKVTYHDPCLLGRLSEPYVPWHGEIKSFGYHDPPKQWRRGTSGVYEAPREVLGAIPGLELLEMTRYAENAFCCGGGGGVPAAFPDFALWTAAERLDEAKSTGANAVVSACPWCESSFQNAIDAGKSTLQYHDFTELVVRALEL
ncbi:MAG: (Fe-S)-binding protein [Chloroflexota bacterium]